MQIIVLEKNQPTNFPPSEILRRVGINFESDLYLSCKQLANVSPEIKMIMINELCYCSSRVQPSGAVH